MRTTSEALGPYFEEFIKSKISQGRYNNASGYGDEVEDRSNPFNPNLYESKCVGKKNIFDG